eukprot:10012798-Heterocapsa_arctica.AAC.1
MKQEKLDMEEKNEFDMKHKEFKGGVMITPNIGGVIITPKKEGVMITPGTKIEKAVQEQPDRLDKNQPAKDEFDMQQKEFDAQIQVLDIPNEIKSGYSPIGF